MTSFAWSIAEQKPRPTPAWQRPFVWVAYWVLHGLYWPVHRLSCWLWQARQKCGIVMYDRPCPRCGASLWAGARGCTCPLVGEVACGMQVEQEIRPRVFDARPAPLTLYVTISTRTALFHWARSHDFFADCARESLARDDVLWRKSRKQGRKLIEEALR